MTDEQDKPVDACFEDDVPASKFQRKPKKSLFQQYADFTTGDNCKRGPAQREAMKATGGFLSGVISVAILIGAGVALGTWAVVVIGIIVFAGMLTGRKH